MAMDAAESGPWHVRAVRLPEGHEPEDWWIVDGRLSDTAVAAAKDVPGGWFLPGGLLDAHCHASMNFNDFAFADGSKALIDANLGAQRAAGVLALRDAGLAWGGSYSAESMAALRIQSAGRLLAAPGRGYPNICVWVEADQLLNAALDELDRGATWVKLCLLYTSRCV